MRSGDTRTQPDARAPPQQRRSRSARRAHLQTEAAQRRNGAAARGGVGERQPKAPAMRQRSREGASAQRLRQQRASALHARAHANSHKALRRRRRRRRRWGNAQPYAGGSHDTRTARRARESPLPHAPAVVVARCGLEVRRPRVAVVPDQKRLLCAQHTQRVRRFRPRLYSRTQATTARIATPPPDPRRTRTHLPCKRRTRGPRRAPGTPWTQCRARLRTPHPPQGGPSAAAPRACP